MPLSRLVLNQLARFRVDVPADLSAAAIEILNEQIDYPKGKFGPSVARFRECLREAGVTLFDDDEDDDLQGDMPLIHNLQFVQSDDWDLDYENDFTGVQPGQVYLAYDSYKYFFLAENPDQPHDPLVLAVDHEDITKEPGPVDYNVTITFGRLLCILEKHEHEPDEEQDEGEEPPRPNYSAFYREVAQNPLLKQVMDYFEDEISEKYDDESSFVIYTMAFLREQSAEEIRAFFDGVEWGDQIASRFNEISAITASNFEKPSPPRSIDEPGARLLIETMVSRVRSLAVECNDARLDEIFAVSNFIPLAVDEDPGDQERSEEAIDRLLELTHSGSPVDHPATANALRDAMGRLLSNDWSLLPYVLWPIYAPKYKSEDPFKPFFDIWSHNAGWNLVYDDPVSIEFWVD